METAALVAPVTCLEFLQDEYLLTGEGPVLSVYSLWPRPKACVSLGVLQHYRIHGIRPRSQEAQSSITAVHTPTSTTESTHHDLAVFGGKAIRLLRLHVDDEENLYLELLGPLMELQDWALDVSWLSGDSHSLLCVAVAHNSALLLDIVKGYVLAQRSCLEGCLLYSALLLTHKSWSDTVLVGGTVFNQLVIWKPGGDAGGGESSDPEHKSPVERRLLGHSGVIFSISYLQKEGCLASASDDRSVRVWGVGALGGFGGNCGDFNPACLRVLFGHQARVFSVHLSPGKVYSGGEDGACLVWDWARDGKVVRRLKGHRAGGVRSLAVSEGNADEERWVATGGADGGVRLWRVEGCEEKKEENEEAAMEKLTDLKFSGEGMPKVVCIAEEEEENTDWSHIKIVVCTDKGSVYKCSDGKWEMIWQGPPEFQSYCVMETVTVGVKGSAAKAHLCAVGNLSGSLQVFPTSDPQSGILLTAGIGKIYSLIWQKGKESVYLLASGTEGLVYRWCVEVYLSEKGSLVLDVTPLPCFLLPPCAKRWLTAAVRLQSRSQEVLWVCGDRRGSLMLFQEKDKSEQMKGGEEVKKGPIREQLADDKGEGYVEKMQTNENKGEQDVNLQPLNCLFGVHGKQGVTSVMAYKGMLYSSGRDGCVRVFRIQPTAPGEQEECGKKLEVLRVQRACKGMEWLEKILILEPETSVEEDNCGEESETQQNDLLKQNEDARVCEGKAREARFVIVGFHAVHFVVWDPVKQERLLAVPCGGGHRSWSLWPSHKDIWLGYGAVIFIKQGMVLTSQPPREATGSVGRMGQAGGWGLREGVHGRGIGCVCRLGRISQSREEIQVASKTETDKGRVGGEEIQWEILVTGGEDTSLSVLAVNPTTGSIKVLSIITDHTSSVRTVTAITGSEDQTVSQSQSLSALLVSAGGRAQIQCYRLLVVWDEQRQIPSCQVIQVAAHHLDAQWQRRRDRHKTVKMDPETRYMDIAVVDVKTNCVLLALSCSDGAVRLFSVSEEKRQIDLLWETFYHQRCVLSVAHCSLEDEKSNRYQMLFTAATDGKIALWHLTEALLSSSLKSSGETTPRVPCFDIPAHQSGVNSLAVWVEKLGHETDCCRATVVSGGDDGQLTVSTVRVQYPEDGGIGGSRGSSQNDKSHHLPELQDSNQLRFQLLSQTCVPLAHAAPLTALKILNSGLIVSTSSDQRVCLWNVGHTGIRHSGALYCHVADASALTVWQEEEGDDKRSGLESEQEMASWGGDEGQAEDETRASTISQETGAGLEGGEPVRVARETDDQVGNESDEKNENERCLKSHSESRKKREKTGWVLVCGQGFQLLRVRNVKTEDDMRMKMQREATMKQLVKVAPQEKLMQN